MWQALSLLPSLSSPLLIHVWGTSLLGMSRESTQNNNSVFILFPTSSIRFKFFSTWKSFTTSRCKQLTRCCLSCFLATQTLSGRTDSTYIDHTVAHPWNTFVSELLFFLISWRLTCSFVSWDSNPSSLWIIKPLQTSSASIMKLRSTMPPFLFVLSFQRYCSHFP